MESTPKVNMNPHLRFPSSWKGDPRLGELTNGKIATYAKAGWYGTQAQKVFRNAEERKKAKSSKFTLNSRPCCSCGTTQTKTKWYKWYDFLPKSGVYCDTCFHDARVEKDRARELAEKVKKAEKERFAAMYV